MKILKIIYTFYTRRAWLLHIGFLLGCYDSTFLISLYVLIVSFILNVIWPGYTRMYTRSYKNRFREIVGHYLPLFFLPRTITSESIRIFGISLGCYIIIHGPKKVYRIYRDVVKTGNQIMT